jgi:hypothetical protein
VRTAHALTSAADTEAPVGTPVVAQSVVAHSAQESLVLDARADLRPAQVVEKKLMSLLRGRGSLASHIQMAGLLKQRGR